MSDRMEMLEAALDLMDEGVALLDEKSNIIFWNKGASALTGYHAADLLSRPCPKDLYLIDAQHLERSEAAINARAHACDHPETLGFAGAIAGYSDGPKAAHAPTDNAAFLDRPALVAMHHHLGHTVPAMLRKVPLRDSLGGRIGAALLFYPVEETDALPHGESGEGAGVERSQANLEDRLDSAHHQWVTNCVPFGILWITVDQAANLRKTHGRDACEAMLRIVEQTLLRGLKPAEIIGRWGNDEFLVISHERTFELLGEHAHRLNGLARTADFRWWGDRVNLTISIGTSNAHEGDTLQALLTRAQHAQQESIRAGGNHVTESRGR
jgi:diguanylate cyclase (GGDEF)-like protein